MDATVIKTEAGISIPVFTKDDSIPPPDPTKTHYIIGYGSLMDTVAKNKLYKNTGPNIPVKVQGYRREWNLKGDIQVWPGSTFLGVVPDPVAKFNAAIFQIPSENVAQVLDQYDQWELLYKRTQVDEKDVEILCPTHATEVKPGQVTYWLYVNKPEFTAYPTKEFPMVQSYVDVFMCGCLEIEEKYGLKDFAKEGVASTKGWSLEHWVNDRIFPRRPFIHQPKAWNIDSVLRDQVPQEYSNIHVESYGLNV